MNILITGSNGFVGRNLAKCLGDYNLFLGTRDNLDLMNLANLENFFNDKNFDLATVQLQAVIDYNKMIATGYMKIV
jgi:dTDP-4-dehydrorhamnose reductase